MKSKIIFIPVMMGILYSCESTKLNNELADYSQFTFNHLCNVLEQKEGYSSVFENGFQVKGNKLILKEDNQIDTKVFMSEGLISNCERFTSTLSTLNDFKDYPLNSSTFKAPSFNSNFKTTTLYARENLGSKIIYRGMENKSDFIRVTLVENSHRFGINNIVKNKTEYTTFKDGIYTTRHYNQSLDTQRTYEQETLREKLRDGYKDLYVFDTETLSDRSFWQDVLELNLEANAIWNRISEYFNNDENRIKDFYFNSKKRESIPELQEEIQGLKSNIELFLISADIQNSYGLTPLSHLHPLFVQLLIENIIKRFDNDNVEEFEQMLSLSFERADYSADSTTQVIHTRPKDNEKFNENIELTKNASLILQTIDKDRCSEWGLKPVANHFFIFQLLENIKRSKASSTAFYKNFTSKYIDSCQGGIGYNIFMNYLIDKNKSNHAHTYQLLGNQITKAYSGFVLSKNNFLIDILNTYKNL